ncbi:hypothetical protein [Bradyrhizobium genosp. SA-3]|uniref:GFA family protein n=1 Tax=Bradyrhizobium genosp. SA-3 TaxID=508868 RepID=UPI001FE06AD8|nr:hypothetical protein [Bradyrhizobium genosp. SA-3]
MSTITGGCHCGAIRHEVEGDAIVHALCHCRDCRLQAGACSTAFLRSRSDSPGPASRQRLRAFQPRA